jgi:hypothetical protein
MALCGFTFFYEHILKREGTTLTFVRAPREKKLPVMLSVEEVRTILAHVKLRRYRGCLTLFSLSCSVHRFLEPLWIVAVPFLAIETLPYRLHHRAVTGQTLFVEVLGRVPQLGADQGPRALRIDPFGGDHDDTAWYLPFRSERGAQFGIDPDGRTAIDSEGATYPGNQEEQRDARVAHDIAQGIDAIVTAPVRQHDGVLIDDAHETRRVTAWRTVQSLQSHSGNHDERRGTSMKVR